LNINQLGPEQSLFHIVPHCSGPKWLIINGLGVFHGGDRNNGTIISPTFLGGPVEIFTKTMVLSTFGAGGPRDLGTMEQWFDQLF
jgi:rhamnose utilization protein RhaD (predicted bifunctional aldolase and dehydrogenase)